MPRFQIQHLVDEEQAAYSAQSAVAPLRDLASDPHPNPKQGAKPGAELPGGATELMGGHTEPPAAARGFADAAQQRARGMREAQQAELEQKTGDTLYRSVGGCLTVQDVSRQGFLLRWWQQRTPWYILLQSRLGVLVATQQAAG